jgi:hypothetical protein
MTLITGADQIRGGAIPVAGIVAFGREPHRHVNVCGIDIAQFCGPRPNTTDLVLSRQIRGDLMSIIDRAVDLLWARTEHRTHIVSTERIEEHAYPLVVLRELDRVAQFQFSPDRGYKLPEGAKVVDRYRAALAGFAMLSSSSSSAAPRRADSAGYPGRSGRGGL